MILSTRAFQLPIWPDPVRGGPNALLRSAFFAGIHSKKRQRLGINVGPDIEPEGITIFAQVGITIKYAGTQLNQYDADVFFQAAHLARRHPLETECLFTGAGFVREIGRSKSLGNYADLDNSLRRLRNGTVDIEFRVKGRPFVFTGSLVSHYVRDKETKLYKVTFAKEILTLFLPSNYTQLEWEERMALMGKPLAQWIHSFYSTHAAPFPLTLAYLHQMTGSPTKRLAHFRTEIKHAFAELQEQFGWAVTWAGDTVSVTKPTTDAQARHIERKARTTSLLKQANQPQPRKRGAGDLLPLGEITHGLFSPRDARRR